MGILKKHPTIILGVVITALFLVFSILRIDFLDNLELKFYDLRMKMREAPGDSDEIVIVDIDDDSIDKLGRWPWPRSLMARAIEKVHEASPKLIGLNMIYSEPEEAGGLKQIKLLSEFILQETGGDNPKILRAMQRAQEQLDNDRKLTEALETADNVVLPVFFKESRIVTRNQKTADEAIASHAVPNVDAAGPGETAEADEIKAPIPPFLEAAEGIGHVNLIYDSDGRVRRDILLFRYRDLYIPSFPLRLAALSLDISNTNIEADLGSYVTLGSRISIPTTSNTRMLVSFKDTEAAFKSYSFFDVINDKIPLNVFSDKIVLITPSASGIMNPFSTPTSQRMNFGEFTANAVWTILNQQFIRQPAWGSVAIYVMIVVVGLLITLVLPRLKAMVAGLTFVLFLGLLVGSAIHLFVSQGLWIEITYPFLQLVFGYIGVVTINFFVTEAGKEKIEGESAETNRMLGLSFQNQGMLDMAFDKFRKVPVDEETKDLLYNLGLDYERKRQYNKAAAVYEYIERYDPHYKDVAPKKKKLLQASESMVFGDGLLSGGSTGGDPLLSGGSETRPTLGRYEVLKQLGKGAMGIVYLGQDPRINRTTAIKTFKFTEGFEPEEAEKLKQKFFREAESAGTLSHPNIVTIYDAGDEHDLAYIAMEFLDGDDFQKYTKKKNLLPMRKVIEYVADIADALDYAHQKGIVHRDVKPANIMILKNKVVKITDFGIARITASSQTQTGVVKGTPHYMSPEQISGKKVDGRSDIFSLGAMLYQLLTGELPFRGDSPAALMHQIMNVRHPDPRKSNPKILKPLVTIIDKALEKDWDKRYQRASHMAKHLRILGSKIDAIMAQKKAASAKSA
ncbi:MAG: CHASE2 domain-containing protein [Desulfococcaceae bacterium]